MSRRNDRRGERGGPWSGTNQDPFVVLGAERAWRADDAVDNGSVTTSIPNYVGASLPLGRNGTGQAIKAATATLGGRLAIACTAGARGYGNDVVYGAAPAALTMVSVARVTADNGGVWAVTVGGVVNTGQSGLMAGTQRTFKTASSAQSALAFPLSFVQVSTFDGANFTDRTNRFTATTTALAAANLGTNLRLMELDSGGLFTLQGAWATFGYWPRVLTASEIAFVMTRLGSRYGISIAP
jgi:hypothetical protein